MSTNRLFYKLSQSLLFVFSSYKYYMYLDLYVDLGVIYQIKNNTYTHTKTAVNTSSRRKYLNNIYNSYC